MLLVEDDEDIAEAIVRGLEKARFQVDTVTTGKRAFDLVLDGGYALMILDLMLPDMDGRMVCERLRRARNTMPVLMLTAKDAVCDRVSGLEAGADDYLVKPFDFSELVARVRALVRRDKVNRVRVVQIADLVIDTSAHRVTRAGRNIGLSPREYALLETLALAEGRVLTRELLQDTVWAGEEVYPNTVDVCIAHLRRKMDRDFTEKLVQTMHGIGYTILSDSENTGAKE